MKINIKNVANKAGIPRSHLTPVPRRRL